MQTVLTKVSSVAESVDSIGVGVTKHQETLKEMAAQLANLEKTPVVEPTPKSTEKLKLTKDQMLSLLNKLGPFSTSAVYVMLRMQGAESPKLVEASKALMHWMSSSEKKPEVDQWVEGIMHGYIRSSRDFLHAFGLSTKSGETLKFSAEFLEEANKYFEPYFDPKVESSWAKGLRVIKEDLDSRIKPT
jgi:hypothetical protein